MNRRDAVKFLKNKPYKFCHLLGFNKMTTLHNRWIKEMVTGTEDKTLQACRNSYKTTSVSFALALIMILLPKKRVLFMRKTDDDVKEIVKQVKKILLDPHTQYFVQVIYGVVLKLTVDNSNELNTNLSIDTKGTSQLTALGTKGSLTGKHFDIIFTDDIVNIDDRTSKAERERTKVVYQELQNLINDNGRIFNTGTPWHKDDCFTIMPEAEKYDCYNPEINPVIFDDARLQEKRENMTASLFAANYELKHIASEDVIFPNPHTGGEFEKILNSKFGHIDAAYNGEDYTAFTIVNKDDDKIYVYGRLWRKHVDDVQDEISQIYKDTLCQRVFNETNGDKGYLAKELRKKGIKVNAYHESTNKFLKITSYLKGSWKNVIFVAGTDQEYIDQVSQYNENADHDDAPDSLASIIRALPQRSERQEEKYKPLWN